MECLKCKKSSRYKDRSYCYKCYKTYCLEKQALIRDRNRQFVFRYLRRFGQCVDCPNNDWRVLEFDHINNDKYLSVSQMCSTHYSLKMIKLEIRKCVLRCANCHRIKTRVQLGWFNN
jgi:hypothetical protein